MLDGLLGRGFSSKCKSLIKATRTRLDVVRRRAEATQRFLKGDLAQLLSNGLDINAFGRTEEFLAGLNLLACYDFLEQSCEYILKKLSMMQKQSQCPEECREAVGSLMFAAARFSDLPELRDLRGALQERYESSLEYFVNQEFFERLAMKPPTIDKKIQLLEDITSELSIKWDSKGFQQRMMANPSASAQNQAKKLEPVHDHGTTYDLSIDYETAVNYNKRDQSLKEKSGLSSDRLKAKNGGKTSLMRKDEVGHQSFREVESTCNRGKPPMGSEQNLVKRDNYDRSPRGRREKGEVSSDELQVKNCGEDYLMRKDELGNRYFRGVESVGNSGRPQMGGEQNPSEKDNHNMTPRGRRERDERSSDEIRAKNGRENYLMRKDELGDLPFGRGKSSANRGKPPMGSEYSTHKKDNNDVTPVGRLEEGEFSSDGLRGKNSRENYLMKKDESDILLFEKSDSMANRGKPHEGSKKSTIRRENNGITPLGRLEEDEFSSDGRAKSGRDNYFLKDESDHMSFGRGSSTGNSHKRHIGGWKNTPTREIYDITPHRKREVTGDKIELAQIDGQEDSVQKEDGHGRPSRGKRPGVVNDVNPHFRQEHIGDKNVPTQMNGKEDTVHRREGHGSLSSGKRLEITDGIYEVQDNKVYGFPRSYGNNSIADNKQEEVPATRDGKNVSSACYRDYKEPNAPISPQIIRGEDADRLKPNPSYGLRPPYVKSKDKLVPPPYMKTVEAKEASSDLHGVSMDPTTYTRDCVNGISKSVQPEDHSNYEDQRTVHARVRSHGHDKDVPYRDNIPLPKPRSIRRKHSKSAYNRDDLGNSEDSEVVKRSSSTRRRDHHSKKGLQILFDEGCEQRDDEDRKLDKLLLHYSKKPSAYDEEKARRKAKSHAREASRDGFDEGEASVVPSRSVSLPREQILPKEQVKVYARAKSFQPDRPAGHVHPKLPDYDDLAAQFAALKGR